MSIRADRFSMLSPPKSPANGLSVWRWCLIALMAAILSGCSRAHYRRQADREVGGLIVCAEDDPRWQLRDYSIFPKSDSRMFDPCNPDRPPMPPDDPTSHLLMQCVDGKRGWPKWGRNGYTPCVENPCWMKYLPRDDDGAVVLDRQSALRMALLHSREYQREMENLYLSALDVTYQRFRFDAQFFGSNSTFFTADGPDRSTGRSRLLEEDNSLRMRKLTATGGELAAGIANSLVWQFAGPDEYNAASLLNFSMFQPLLREAGRAVVLENLTQSERTLLANVRQTARFQQGFYVQIIAGRSLPAGPARGALGLNALQPNLFGNTGGIFSLLSAQVRIRNQRANIAARRGSLNTLEAIFDAGRIDRLQGDQIRQQFYNTQISLGTLKQNYQDALDAYKITLGLPPELEVRIDDPLLKRFDLIDEKTTNAQESVSDLLAKLRDPEQIFTPADFTVAKDTIPARCRVILKTLAEDFQSLEAALPARRQFIRLLSTREELANGDVEPNVANLEAFDQWLNTIGKVYQDQQAKLETLLKELEAFPAGEESNTSWRDDYLELLTRLSNLLGELSLTQARCRAETLTLVPVQLDSSEALEIARENRLDWMNARAALVDAWRQVEVTANALRGDLSVVLNGDISTTGNNPLRFRGTTGRLQAGLQFDPPLTRLAERNIYREALIEYQQARRQYYAYEDRVSQGLRDLLRTIQRIQLDFELRRATVHVVINQVDAVQLRLQEPPKPGTTGTFAGNTARDIDQALTGLLNAQNSLLDAWVDYEAQRMNLDFDLGTMRLDSQGQWIDPGSWPLHTS